MKAHVSIATAALLSLSAAHPAWALLSDDPYFNLWTGTANNGDSGGLQTVVGETYTVAGIQFGGDSIALCGREGALCDGNASATAGADKGYAHFYALYKNTGKGSGAIDPFLRFQHNEGDATGKSTTEAAFNTSNNDIGTITTDGKTIDNQAKDVNAGKDFNHAIKLSDLVADSDGYFTFLLDINEPSGTKALLRLDELEFFVGKGDQLNTYVTDYNPADVDGMFGQLSGVGQESAVKVWDMDFNGLNKTGGLNTAGGFGLADPQTCGNGAKDEPCPELYGGLHLDNINDSGPAGSGDYDMAVRVHKDLFIEAAEDKGWGDNAFVYLYNFAGEADSDAQAEAQAGFEEWAAVVETSPTENKVPEPATATLLGLGILGALRRASKMCG